MNNRAFDQRFLKSDRNFYSILEQQFLKSDRTSNLVDRMLDCSTHTSIHLTPRPPLLGGEGEKFSCSRHSTNMCPLRGHPHKVPPTPKHPASRIPDPGSRIRDTRYGIQPYFRKVLIINAHFLPLLPFSNNPTSNYNKKL